MPEWRQVVVADGSGEVVLVAPVVPRAREDDEEVRLVTVNSMEARASISSSRSGRETRPEARVLRRPSVELE